MLKKKADQVLKSKKVKLPKKESKSKAKPLSSKKPKIRIDLSQIKREVESELRGRPLITKKEVNNHRKELGKALNSETNKRKRHQGHKGSWMFTGIDGFDTLLKDGIPKGTANIICGGPGSGKTIFGLQTLYNGAMKGEKCIYMTFEESEERLLDHMCDFGWNPEPLIKKGKLMIKRYDPFEITRQVEAMLEKSKGELLIDVDPIVFPKGFEKPDRIVVDSLSAIAAAFTDREDSYRIYIEHLFRLFEKIGATSFMIAETGNVPTGITRSGVEEFLADGVILVYNVKRGNIRESAIEVLKMRGAEFEKKIVAMDIIDEAGIIVYPDQEIFGEINK